MSTPIPAFLASFAEVTTEEVFGMIYLSILLIYYPEIQRLAEQKGNIRCAFYLFLFYLCFIGRYCAPDTYLVYRYLCQLDLVDSDPTDFEVFFCLTDLAFLYICVHDVNTYKNYILKSINLHELSLLDTYGGWQHGRNSWFKTLKNIFPLF